MLHFQLVKSAILWPVTELKKEVKQYAMLHRKVGQKVLGSISTLITV